MNGENTTNSQNSVTDLANEESSQTKPIHTCTDVRFPLSELIEAMRKAHVENPLNPDPDVVNESEFKAAAPNAKLWKPGRTLQVRFMHGHPVVKAKVEQYAREWENYCSIKLDFNDAPNAEIRIAFLDGLGSWSYIGTDNLSIDINKPTMNFGWLTVNSEEEEYSRVVIHEFGHALGLIHEHQNPAAKIPWNEKVVYEYYAGPPNNWSKEQVDNNLFAKYSKEKTQFSKFDKTSIMLYPIPPEFVTDSDFVVGSNSVLSDEDKKFIGKLYS